MDKEHALHCLDVYLNNVSVDIKNSAASPEAKRLVAQVAQETANAMASIIDALFE